MVIFYERILSPIYLFVSLLLTVLIFVPVPVLHADHLQLDTRVLEPLIGNNTACDRLAGQEAIFLVKHDFKSALVEV